MMHGCPCNAASEMGDVARPVIVDARGTHDAEMLAVHDGALLGTTLLGWERLFLFLATCPMHLTICGWLIQGMACRLTPSTTYFKE